MLGERISPQSELIRAITSGDSPFRGPSHLQCCHRRIDLLLQPGHRVERARRRRRRSLACRPVLLLLPLLLLLLLLRLALGVAAPTRHGGLRVGIARRGQPGPSRGFPQAPAAASRSCWRAYCCNTHGGTRLKRWHGGEADRDAHLFSPGEGFARAGCSCRPGRSPAEVRREEPPLLPHVHQPFGRTH